MTVVLYYILPLRENVAIKKLHDLFTSANERVENADEASKDPGILEVIYIILNRP